MLNWLSTEFGFRVALMAVLFGIIMTTVAYCILAERKISAWIQDRIGPNRVGPGGLLQPIADGVKFLLKEDITRPDADRPVFVLAPCIAFVVAAVGFAVIPWAGRITLPGGQTISVQVASLDIGLLYVLAVGSLSVYGVVLGGWASNNKYSFYGGMRAAAQMLSYEIPMGLAILVVVLTTGQLRLESIVDWQLAAGSGTGTWLILLHPLAFILLLIAAFAETNRMPFDLAEAEQELVGGYQTEYSSMKMALFYLGEYAHMITAAAFISVLFLGGWELFPFSERLGWRWLGWYNTSTSWSAMLLRFSVMFGKVLCFIVFYMWVRWTIPRFRFDQLMRLAWKGLVPIAMALVSYAAILVYVRRESSIWAPIGNALILAAVLVLQVLIKPDVTGRQANLPPVAGAAMAVRRNR